MMYPVVFFQSIAAFILRKKVVSNELYKLELSGDEVSTQNVLVLSENYNN